MKKTVKLAVEFPFNFYAARSINIKDDTGEVISSIQNGARIEISTLSNTLEFVMWPYKQVINLENEGSETYVNISLKGSNAASHLWTSLDFKNYLLLSKVSKSHFAQFDQSKRNGLVEIEKITFALYLLPVILIMYTGIISEENDFRNLAFLFSTVTLASLAPDLFRKKTGFKFLNRRLIGTLILSIIFIYLLKVETIIALGAVGLMLFTTIRIHVQGKIQLTNQDFKLIA